MPYTEGTFTSFDGLALFERCWQPEDSAKAEVILLHGFLDHSGRYAELAGRLNECGYSVAAFDLRGHGLSAGERIFVRSFHHYVDDLALFIGRVRERTRRRRPVYVLAHSLGGLIAALYAASGRPEVNGLVLAGPLVKRARTTWWGFGNVVGPPLARLFPRLRLVSLGRDDPVPQNVDELVYRGRIPMRTGAEILSAIRRLQERMAYIELPLLIVHGARDRVAAPEGSHRLYRRARSADKALKIYDGYHDLLRESGREAVLDDVLGWLEERAARAARAGAPQ